MPEEYRSRAYADRPDYADFDSPAKFAAIQSIIAKRLTEHPKAICSYSGGSDSDILIDLIERTRAMFDGKLPEVKYEFFNTGLEMQTTRDHVKETAQKYGVEIKEYRPKKNIVLAAREYGIPFISKIFSQRLEEWQKYPVMIPLDLGKEWEDAEDKQAKRKELEARFPRAVTVVKWLCGYDAEGERGTNSQFYICGKGHEFIRDFMLENPPDFKVSAKCCKYCKKDLAHEVQKGYEMVITGERKAEGGIRSVGKSVQTCFQEESNGQYRLRPLYYVSDKDKAWYKEHYGIRYSDAYEVYGMKRTGCCGCPINYRAVEDLKLIEPYEPNVVKAAWNIFGKSYEYRAKYMAYRKKRRQEEREEKARQEESSTGQVKFQICADERIDEDAENSV